MQDKYSLTQNETVAKRWIQLSAEYAQAINMILTGCVIPLNNRLRQSLHRVAREAQSVLDEGVMLKLDDLAMLCATETTESFNSDTAKSRNDYARTLFALSKATLF